MIKTTVKDNVLTLSLEGRIDSTNAADIERDVMAAANDNPGADIIIDVENLEYISSAGLRVLMKLRRQAKKALPVMNASSEVYDIFEVTGFTELLDVHRRMREVSVEGCQEMGSGANGTVYRYTPDEMIKVFRAGLTLAEIEAEREAAKKAFLLGVPCAIAFDTVKVGDRYGTMYELLKAGTLEERIREKSERLEELAEKSTRLLRELHAIEVPEGRMPPADRSLHAGIDRLTADFTPDEIDRLHALYRSIPPMNRFVHTDYHAKNIMETGDGELLLIDMGDAGAGNPLIDLIHCYMIYNIMGAGMGQHRNDEMSFIGLTYGELRRFWIVFGETYFGSAQKAKAMDALLDPYGHLMYYASSMSNPRLPAQYHPVYAGFMREKVLSRYGELLGSLDGVWEA